jgi:hypothetical protein
MDGGLGQFDIGQFLDALEAAGARTASQALQNVANAQQQASGPAYSGLGLYQPYVVPAVIIGGLLFLALMRRR